MVMNRVEGLAWLRKQLETADVDLLRERVRAMADTLMGAEATSRQLSVASSHHHHPRPDKVTLA